MENIQRTNFVKLICFWFHEFFVWTLFKFSGPMCSPICTVPCYYKPGSKEGMGVDAGPNIRLWVSKLGFLSIVEALPIPNEDEVGCCWKTTGFGLEKKITKMKNAFNFLSSNRKTRFEHWITRITR